ncbi:hypothetical protein Patl1_29591 [Pistacia atlantica]|uniref:Uncharacterized protein n=1 Tax=Pistacia atlantica TaxID=434234 RepID=A0ACC1AD56_9ROSI|nr:hypothetical protein Patl1_29591 [Pistacia atlantica]
MNMKEQLRVKVKKELHKLETTCIDMASLLRALGINVGSSFHPLSNECNLCKVLVTRFRICLMAVLSGSFINRAFARFFLHV